jgi:hypothetical protein
MENLEFSADHRDFFEADNLKLVAFEALQDHVGHDPRTHGLTTATFAA